MRNTETMIHELGREHEDSTASFERTRKELTTIVEIEDRAGLEAAMREVVSDFRQLEGHDGAAVAESIEWFEGNNHRVNLYKIGGLKNERWDDEPMDEKRGKLLLTLKKMDLCLKQAVKLEDKGKVAEWLENTIRSGRLPAHGAETAVDSLARTGVVGGAALERIIGDADLSLHIRARAAMAGMRYGEVSSDFRAVCLPILQGLIKSAEPADVYSAVEMAGVIDGKDAKDALKTVGDRIGYMKGEQAEFVMRDWISTSLAADPTFGKRVGDVLSGRARMVEGVCFGSTGEMPDFDAFMEANREKIEAMAEALARTNDAFGHEPVLFVDIVNDSRENMANEGWSANSLYVSRTLTGHPRVSVNSTVQGLIHEACERWESKGFVDADMERDYLELMGASYEGSELDKFRLKHRIDTPSQAGHPWDGTREYMAEAGSFLLADPTAAQRLFDAARDGEALTCLDRVRQKIEKHKSRSRFDKPNPPPSARVGHF